MAKTTKKMTLKYWNSPEPDERGYRHYKTVVNHTYIP